MKVLLDENFPLGLARALEADDVAVDHIITLGLRGASDRKIRERLNDAELVFLTQDEDFLSGPTVASTIVVSRVRQSRKLTERIQVWRHALQQLTTKQITHVFELTDDGDLVPWPPAKSDG